VLSIIMPVRNGARFAREAIDSITLGADQPVEIIVVDDASTDETPEILEELGLSRAGLVFDRLPQSLGPGPARNHGLTLARGDTIGFLDADDRYAPGALDSLLARLAENTEVDVVIGRVCSLRRNTSEGAPDVFEPTGDQMRCFQLGGFVARRSVFERFGGFDPAYRHGEDMDWFFRVQEGRARFDFVDQLVLHHRRHDRNMSDLEPQRAIDIAMVLGASLARRKKISAETGTPVDEIYYFRPERTPME